MAAKLGIKLRKTMPEEWNDLELGIFVYTRTATLMKQIIASTFVKESRYNAPTLHELLNKIGDLDSKPKQEELFSLLEKLLSPIEDGNLASALDSMVKNATKQLHSIQKFCWRGHSELIKSLQDVILPPQCREEGWNPEEVMNALVLALVHEMISLFELGLSQLIIFAKNFCGDAFDENTTQALEEIDTLHSAVMSADACFMEGQRKDYLDNYQVVVSEFDFKRHFTFQSLKQRQNYVDMVPADEVPWEIWRTLSKLVIDLQQKRCDEQKSRDDELRNITNEKGKLRNEITANELEILKLKQENRNSPLAYKIQEAELLKIKHEEQLVVLNRQMEECNYLRADHASLLERINHLTSESFYWKKKYQDLRLDLFKELAKAYATKAKSINESVLKQSGIGERTHSKCDTVDLYLTVTVNLIENLGVLSGEQPFDDDENDGY